MPHQHEIKSKLKTQIVKDKTKYNRVDSKRSMCKDEEVDCILAPNGNLIEK